MEATQSECRAACTVPQTGVLVQKDLPDVPY